MQNLHAQPDTINVSAHERDGFGILDSTGAEAKSFAKYQGDQTAAEHCQNAISHVLVPGETHLYGTQLDQERGFGRGEVHRTALPM